MNSRVGWLLLVGAVVSMSGCGARSPGDVTFLWSFEGQGCGLVPDVSRVVVDIPGQTLENSGVYSCLTAGTAGIKLFGFRGGSYPYTVRGQASDGTTLYQATGSFVVDGDVIVNVDLRADPNAPATVSITWAFPPNGATNGRAASCAEAGVTDLYLAIDNVPVSVSCQDGNSSPGVAYRVTPGQHSIEIAGGSRTGLNTAQGPNVFYLYQKTSTLTAMVGNTAQNHYSLDWSAGSFDVRWSFANNLNCAQNNVNFIDLYITDPTSNPEVDVDLLEYPGYQKSVRGGRIVYNVPCLSSGSMGIRFPYANGGRHKIDAVARSSTGVDWIAVTATEVNVVPGRFDSPPSTSVVMTLR